MPTDFELAKTGFRTVITNIMRKYQKISYVLHVRVPVEAAGLKLNHYQTQTKQNPSMIAETSKSTPIYKSTHHINWYRIFNTFRGIHITEGVPVNFRADENVLLQIKDIKEKESGTFTAESCLKWLGEPKLMKTKYGVEKKIARIHFI